MDLYEKGMLAGSGSAGSDDCQEENHEIFMTSSSIPGEHVTKFVIVAFRSQQAAIRASHLQFVGAGRCWAVDSFGVTAR